MTKRAISVYFIFGVFTLFVLFSEKNKSLRDIPSATTNALKEIVSEKKPKLDFNRAEVISKNPINKTQKEKQDTVEMLSKCIEKDFSTSASLFQVAEQQGWTDSSTHKVVKRNFIYKKNNQEKRLHIVPEENSTKWRVQLFDVDLEGLPIPVKRTVADSLTEALSLFESQLDGMSLESDEVLIEVDQGSLTGSILTLQETVAEIKLYDKKSAKVFECISKNCACNSVKI